MLYLAHAHKHFRLLFLSLIVASPSLAQQRAGVRPAAATPISITDSTREHDGLTGPVRRVRTELAKLTVKSGRQIEGKRVLLETTAYDLRGRRIENALYPIDESPVIGREEYKYDDKGNVSEKIQRDDSGAVLGKEVYTYEFDAVGNWTKMTTLLAVVEGGRVSFEPTEVTHRTITYFFGQDAASTPAENQASSQRAAPVASAPLRKMPNLSYTNEGAPWLEPSVTASSGDGVQQTTDPKIPVSIGTEAPALNAAPGQINGKLQLGKPLSLPKPVYPDIARQARLTGAVAVEVVVDGKGHVVAARAVSGHAQLRGAAVEAARQAVFSPTLVAGQPTEVVGVINYSFSYVK